MAIVRRDAKTDPKLRWFDEARFGMFVHYGFYSLLGRGEWVMYRGNIPRGEYEKLMHRFNPKRFDANGWIDVAEQAGAKYITVTAKHHDGFCLFDSDLTDYKITNTPFGRDLIGELVAACRRRGMRIVLYYSQPDWHHPNFVNRPGAFKDLQDPPATDEPNWPKYLAYYEGQVRELCTKYGRIDGIWFDGSHKSEADWRGRRLYRMIKKHQPTAIVNERARCGDFFTPERRLPDDLTGYLFEACESITARGWGYSPDSPLFSSPHLIESLVRMAAAGGNYLLNVGPKPDGTIPAAQIRRMKQIGAWLSRNGEAVYRTDACKLVGADEDALATRKGNNVYLHLLRWPATDRLVLPGVASRPVAATMPADGKALDAELTPDGLTLSGLPPRPANTNVQVIHLKFRGEPKLTLQRPPKQIVAAIDVAKGKARLPAEDALFTGRAVKGHLLHRRELTTGRQAISDWTALEQVATWKVNSPRRRRVRVRVRMSCRKLYAGSTFAVRCGSQALTGEVPGTADFDTFRTVDVGVLTLPAGKAKLSLRATFMPYGYIFAQIQSIDLTPA